MPSETKTSFRTGPDPTATTMPGGIPYIVGNEAAERFSFYGMRGILYIFMTDYMLNASGQKEVMDEETARIWYHNFIAVAYLFPIVGAVLSDWLLGKYRTILYLSIIYCLGHAVMAMVDFPTMTNLAPRTTLLYALAMISIGTGGIKPCVASHVGDQFGPGNKHLLPKVFYWFYFSINLGAAASYLIIPRLLKNFGPGVAFGVPGVLMAIATLVFWLGRHKFIHVPPSGNKIWTELRSSTGMKAILNLIPLYLFLAAFWMLFDQTSSAWVEQAKSMNRNLFGFELNPSENQATNPILIMLLIPLFSFYIYPLVSKYWELTPLRKIGIGMLIAPISFIIPAFIQQSIDAGENPSIGWQIFAYVIITAAEILISITALEFSYTQAPSSLKSIIMGLFYLSVFLGNKITAYVNTIIKSQKELGVTILEGENYYWFFTGMMLLTAIAYTIWAPFYRGKTYIQGEEELLVEAGA